MKECPPVIVVGNKCDLNGAQRVVTTEEGKALAVELGQTEGQISFAETSAKTNYNVYEVFADVIRRRKVQRDNEQEKEEKVERIGWRGAIAEDYLQDPAVCRAWKLKANKNISAEYLLKYRRILSLISYMISYIIK